MSISSSSSVVSPTMPRGTISISPRPVERTACPMASNSASSANVPGTGSPSLAVWTSVRELEKPNAPARTASFTRAAILAMSASVAGSFLAPRSPITKARSAPCVIMPPTSRVRGMDSSTSRYSEKLCQPHGNPADKDGPGMSSTPSIRPISQSWRSGVAGANPTPQLPITTVETPCHSDGVICSSQATWPS